MLAFSNKKSTIVLISGTFLLLHFLNIALILFESSFFTKKAPQTTILTAFNAKLHQFMEKFC